MKSVSFDYAFATPHAITLCRPSASEKFIADLTEAGIKFSRTYRTPKDDYPLAWTPHAMDVTFYTDISVGGATASFEKWYRHESGAPCLFAEGSASGISFCMEAIAAKTGVIVKTTVTSEKEEPDYVQIQFAHTNGWVISNQGWIDGVNKNLLLTMNHGRVDRVLALAYGADDYPLYGKSAEEFDHLPPMNDLKLGVAAHSMKKITAYYKLEKGQSKTGYFLMPYENYLCELDALRALDLEGEIAEAISEWEALLKRSARFDIADPTVLHCYRACLADLFVMRERIGEYTGVVCGTRFYRSANSGEPLETEILFDTLGYTAEAEADYPLYLEGQDPNGCWVSSKGWEHEIWGCIYNKANAVLEHYYITRDKDFLEENYRRMLASSIFNREARRGTRNAAAVAERGLMPRGMGDCGLMNGADYYGVYYPLNAMAIAADRKTLEAAEILGKTEDVAMLTALCEEAEKAFFDSLYANLTEIEGCLMMPAAPNAPASSIYGCMFPFFPARLVGADEPMIRGAVSYIEGKRLSEGGLPLGTGWQRDGLWVAMALGSIARTYLRLGLYKEARKYLYPALDHASPFVTYCEERGGEKKSARKTGDLHHLWTPLSVCQYMVDAFWFEEKEVHVCAGIVPEWLTEGKRIALSGLKTHYGATDILVTLESGEVTLTVKTERPMEKDVMFHLPRVDGVKDIPISAVGKTEIMEKFKA